MTDIEDLYRLQNILVRLEIANDLLYDVPKHLLRPVEEELLNNTRKDVCDLKSRVLHRKLEMLNKIKGGKNDC